MAAEHNEQGLRLARACADHMYANDLASRNLGITITVPAPGEVVAEMPVTDEMLNGHDICHGGYIFILADSAFAFACNAYDRVTVAAAAQIDFVAPARRGDCLSAHAKERSRTGRSGLYDVEVTAADGRLIALFRGRSATLKERMLAQPDT